MKIALCFIISYEHILNKEVLWREWIEYNKDIINIYFYYKDINKIKSQWILRHVIPQEYIYETSYFHVIPAYISLMNYSFKADPYNQWCCLLTDSCCPIISPQQFRALFFKYFNKSIMHWRRAWWNISFHKRANLALLPSKYHLGNDPWFTLKREHALQIINYMNNNKEFVKTICNGGLANESLFAIILKGCGQLDNGSVLNEITHLTDWNRMSSFTSPHLFKEGNAIDLKFIDAELERNKCALFIRKVAPEFSNDILRGYIYNKTVVIAVEPFEMYMKEWYIFCLINYKIIMFLVFSLFFVLFYSFNLY
jgi:hypothetical protein